jgi:glyoxylase-like metal-dependent hydrolase (beta-lactamase superfamily II)
LTDDVLEESLSWLQPKHVDPTTGKLVLCIQSYLVQTPHHTILVDSCVGNEKGRPARPFWHMMTSDRFERGLAATGVHVNQIDYVMCTHLHVDHVGWNTRLENGRWVPTFPNAKYLFADRELAFWTERHKDQPEACAWFSDSVLPIVEAKRFELVKSNHSLSDLVHLVPTPGHTIDHYSVRVGKAGADAFITGDMVHSPLQMRYPELGMMSDFSSGRPNAAGGVHTTQRYAYGRVHRALPIAVRRPDYPMGQWVPVPRKLSRVAKALGLSSRLPSSVIE